MRGFDYNLPTGVQQMTWSDPEKLVVAKPKFKIVASAPKRKFKVVPVVTLGAWTPTSTLPSRSQTTPTR